MLVGVVQGLGFGGLGFRVGFRGFGGFNFRVWGFGSRGIEGFSRGLLCLRGLVFVFCYGPYGSVVWGSVGRWVERLGFGGGAQPKP